MSRAIPMHDQDELTLLGRIMLYGLLPSALINWMIWCVNLVAVGAIAIDGQIPANIIRNEMPVGYIMLPTHILANIGMSPLQMVGAMITIALIVVEIERIHFNWVRKYI